MIPLFHPTAAQVAQAGNQVCSAFDAGQTYSQVKAQALSMAGQYRNLIPASAPDWAARKLVAMYCPGYASKIG